MHYVRGTEVVKRPLYSIGPKIRVTNVVKHPFYTIGPKMMFGCVSEYFANLQHVKDAKLVFELERVPKL
jgi:hypothetical protein